MDYKDEYSHTHHIAVRSTSPLDSWLNSNAPFPGRNIVKETGSMQDMLNMCCYCADPCRNQDNNNTSNNHLKSQVCEYFRSSPSLDPLQEDHIDGSDATNRQTIVINRNSLQGNDMECTSNGSETTMIFKTFKHGIKQGELSLYEAALAAKKMKRSPSTSMIINASMTLPRGSFSSDGNMNDCVPAHNGVHHPDDHLFHSVSGSDECGDTEMLCRATASYNGPRSLSGLLIPEIFVVEEKSTNANTILPVNVNSNTPHENSIENNTSTHEFQKEPLTLSCMELQTLRDGDVKVIGLLMNKGWRCLDSHLKRIAKLDKATAALYKGEALRLCTTAKNSNRSAYDVDLLFHPITNIRLLAAILFLVANGLNQLHYLNFSHNDLRLPNILIWKTNHVRICDFEFSRPVSQPSYDLESHYRTPEGTVDDIWCFGLLAIEMMTGLSPFISPNIADDFAPDYLALADLGWEGNLRAAVAERIAAYHWCMAHQRQSSEGKENQKSGPSDEVMLPLVNNHGFKRKPGEKEALLTPTAVQDDGDTPVRLLQLLDNMLSLCLHNNLSNRLTPYEEDVGKQNIVLLNHPFFVEALLPIQSKGGKGGSVQSNHRNQNRVDQLATLDRCLMENLENAAVEQLAAWR
eukprot:Tbor_TRINITY_DN5228_c0_g1::TRINITY_DN5228_c0_g1_i1::g.16873::m.16873